MGKADRMLLLAAASVAAFLFGSQMLDYLLALVALGLLATIVLRLGKTHEDLKGLGPKQQNRMDGSRP